MTISRRALFTLDFDRPPASIDRLVRVHRTAMACRVEVALHECDARHVAAARDALDEADRVEALLTVFRESSELSRVNREGAAGAAGVDPEVFRLLQRCAQLYLDTDGAFDITSSPLSRCWGLLTREGRLPSTGEIEAARACIGMLHVDVDATTRSVRFGRDGMALNLNAFGKGYALDCMAVTLRARGTDRALLSAGGSSVLAMGGAWPVDIRSPLSSRPRLARVRLAGAALGTSGAGEQFVIADGVRYGHVIDPRSGMPATGVLSASAVAADAATADALSTAFLIGGPALARCYCESHRGTMALLALDGCDFGPLVFGAHPGATVEN
jgi:thiamine biosynthesis lipoprotein